MTKFNAPLCPLLSRHLIRPPRAVRPKSAPPPYDRTASAEGVGPGPSDGGRRGVGTERRAVTVAVK